MNDRRRLVVGLGAGITLTLLTAAFSAFLTIEGHRRGWAGMSITPPDTRGRAQVGTGKAGVMQYTPQGVMLTYPGSPSHRAGIRLSDKVLTINGIDFKNSAALRELDARTSRGDVVTYTIEREGKRLVIPVRFQSPFRNVLTALQSATYISVALVFLFTGFFIFSRRPDDRRVVIFYILTLLIGLSMLGMSGAAVAPMTARGIVWDHDLDFSFVAIGVFAAVALASIPLTLHMALVFPRDRPFVRRAGALRWVYGVPIATILGCFALVFLNLVHRTIRQEALIRGVVAISTAIAIVVTIAIITLVLRRRTASRFQAFVERPVTTMASVLILLIGTALLLTSAGARTPARIFAAASALVPVFALMAMPVFSFVCLYRSYRDANVEERRQVAWPLWGTMIALGGRILTIVISYAVSGYTIATHGDFMKVLEFNQYFDLVSRALLILIPLSFAFAILKYRLMNIDVIIRKTVVYAILSGAIAVVYIVLVGGLGTLLLNATGVKNQTVVIASTLFVALVFVPLRNKLQTLVDRNLFRHKYEYPDALRAIAAEALVATELAPFLGSAAEKVQQALQNRSVVIFAQRHDEHIATAKVGVSDNLLGTLRVPDRSIREALDRPFDPRRRALPDEAAKAFATVEAVLVVPINTPGTLPNGFLTLGSKLSGAEPDVEDIDFLRSVADQLDIGIDRIRQQRDEADFAQARAIQNTLLPREMPRVSGIDVSGVWKPARDVGGDYFDVLKLGESQLAVCIGDVAGKGMPAALLMSGLQASVRVSAFESGSPCELCERVRRVVVSSLSGGRFVTFFYAIVDTASMRVRWCNAGHNAPILARADGSIVRLSEGGPAISRLFRDQPYVDSEMELRLGDRLVLFTDGASEARDASGEMYGETQLEQFVATSQIPTARALQDAIVDAVTRFSRGEAEDDLTLVVVKV